MNPPQVYMCSPSWTLLPPPSPYHLYFYLYLLVCNPRVDRVYQCSPKSLFTGIRYSPRGLCPFQDSPQGISVSSRWKELVSWSKFSSVQFSRLVMSDSLQPHGLQHNRPPCPSPTPGVCSNSCPLSQWCHPTISSSVVPFSSHLQSLPASGSFQMSQFASGGQSIGV